MAEKRHTTLEIPHYVLGEREMMALRMSMISLDDDEGNTVASLSTGAGLGSDAIWFKVGDVKGYIRGRDLLAHLVHAYAGDQDKGALLKALGQEE